MGAFYRIIVTVRGDLRYLQVDVQKNLKITEDITQAAVIPNDLVPLYKELVRARFNVGSVDHEEV